MIMHLTKNQLISILKRNFPDCIVNIHTADNSGNIIGTLTSKEFDNMHHDERQWVLNKVINDVYSGHKIENVGPIVILTPAEYKMRLQDVYG